MISILQNIKSGSFDFLKPVFKEQIIKIFNALISENKEKKIKLINEIIKEYKMDKLILIKEIEINFEEIYQIRKSISTINSEFPISQKVISELDLIIYEKIIRLVS